MFIKESVILDRFKETHNDRYDYSLVEYKGINKKVEIICKEHGSFWQGPESHFNGQGCPSCSKTGYDGTKPGIFYYLNIEKGKAFKIGITNNSVRKRYYKPDLDRCEVLLELYFEDGYKAAELERLIINKFKDKKWKGKPLLKGTGIYEIFSENILSVFNNIISVEPVCKS